MVASNLKRRAETKPFGEGWSAPPTSNQVDPIDPTNPSNPMNPITAAPQYRRTAALPYLILFNLKFEI